MSALRARIASLLADSAWPWAVAVLLSSLVVVRPWGNYALNDDWTYAHIAKHFAETGVMRLDSPVVAATVGQALLAAPAILLFGFSHTALRVLTVVLACVGLWCLDRLLALAVTSRRIRLLALVLVALNPIYFYCSATFMTEIYGWVPAMLGALVWFEGRRRACAAAADGTTTQHVSWRWSVGSAAVLGATFWIRQPCVIIYPAAVAATLLHLGVQRQWQALRRSLWPVAAGVATLAVLSLAFFTWARATGNLTAVLSTRLPNLLRFDRNTYVMQGGAILFYMTAYFLPALALVAAGQRLRWRAGAAAIAFAGLALWARALFQTYAGSPDAVGMNWIHRAFPFVMNVIYNAGLGPVTVSDVFWHGAPPPRWPVTVWSAVEGALLCGTLLWGPASMAAWRALRRSHRTVAFEVLAFALVLAGGGGLALIQQSQQEVTDRYHFPVILACALWLPAVLERQRRSRPPGAGGVVAFAALFAPVAVFSVFGLHDQFRWNDARWAMVERAFALGGRPGTVEGGFEVSCWHREEKMWPATPEVDGVPLRCQYFAACCLDDRFRVGMAVLPGYQAIASQQPSYWLAPGPPLILSGRR